MTVALWTTLIIWNSLLTLAALLLWPFCWARLRAQDDTVVRINNHLAEQLKAISGEVPEKRLQEVEGTLDSFRARIDSAQLENDKFREQTYKQIQRFDQIMRRNENAVKKLDGDLPRPEPEQYPDNVPASSVQNPNIPSAKATRAELRAFLRQRSRG